MSLSWRQITWCGINAAEIAGAPSGTSRFSVPKTAGGLPVTRIGRSAFADHMELTGIVLPDSLRELGDFAFQGCRNLRYISFPCTVQEIGSGAFRECVNLRRIEIRNFAAFPQLIHPFRGLCSFLADTDAAVTVLLRLPDRSACLYFPDQVNDFDEDTMARAIHPRIEGCGYAYRAAVSQDALDFRGYDLLFPRARLDGVKTAAEIAFARLLCPYELKEPAAEAYRAFLKECAAQIVPQLVEEEDAERLAFLARENLLTPDAVDAGLRAASAAHKTELCGILMDGARSFSAGKGGTPAPEIFSL